MGREGEKERERERRRERELVTGMGHRKEHRTNLEQSSNYNTWPPRSLSKSKKLFK